MILGLLTEQGPTHGHQVRRMGEQTNVEAWGGITGGALYRKLHRLVGEHLIRPIREEQVGHRPARTVYEITKDARLELVVQREAALRSLFESADLVAVVCSSPAEARAASYRPDSPSGVRWWRASLSRWPMSVHA